MLLCCRGTSKSASKAAFRERFSRLHELRSLVPPGTPFTALTATATQATKETIFSVLRMKDCVEICNSPDKANITYSVLYMDKNTATEEYFEWIVTDVSKFAIQTPRVIIYCQSIKQCHVLYSLLRAKLGKYFYKHSIKSPSNAFVEMLHSCTPEENKNNILTSFQDLNGTVRVLVATMAFGTGVNCKGVRTVVHFGPSKNIEAYVQECGRAGRDGQPSHTWLLYNGMMQIHVEADIKAYLKTKECRRKHILRSFAMDCTHPEPLHRCCDNCAQLCECKSAECDNYTTYPALKLQTTYISSQERNDITQEQRQKVKEALIIYRKELVRNLISKSPGENLTSIINPRFLLGFSTLQINQVMENLKHLFTIKDITSLWDMGYEACLQGSTDPKHSIL